MSSTKETLLNLMSSIVDFNIKDEEDDTDDDFLHKRSAMMVKMSVDLP